VAFELGQFVSGGIGSGQHQYGKRFIACLLVLESFGESELALIKDRFGEGTQEAADAEARQDESYSIKYD
jgi:hypothetical protein